MISSASTILFGAAFRALFTGSAVWAGLRMLRVKNVWTQKAAWSAVLMAALAMPFLVGLRWSPGWAEVRLPASPWLRPVSAKPMPPISPVQVDSRTAEISDSDQAPYVESEFGAAPNAWVKENIAVQTGGRVGSIPTVAPPAALQTATPPQERRGSSVSLLTACWLAYLAVVAALLLRLTIGLASSFLLWLRAEPVDAAQMHGFDGGDPVRSSRQVSSPVNIGSGIVLPADFAQWDAEKLRIVLAHERSHIRQYDFYLQLLAGVYAAVNWMSPLGWWLKHKLSELSEAISDRAGLEEAASPSAYAHLLLDFAALQRPTLTGVTMSHSSNLSRRIERLLDDSTFRQAFSTGRAALVAAFVVPTVLVAATALVRVQAAPLPQPATTHLIVAQAAGQNPAQDQAQSPQTGQSNAAQVTDAQSDQAPAATPQPAPSAAPGPEVAPAPPLPPEPALPAMPPIAVQVQIPPIPPIPPIHVFGNAAQGSCMGNGDAYAIVGDPGTKTQFCGNWGAEGAAEVHKARNTVHGHFLLFRHEGKYYVVDDPAIVRQIEGMDKALQDQGDQMRALGQQMRDAGQQAREAGEQAREAGEQARENAANIPKPELSKEIAALDASVASMKAQQGNTISREQLQELQREISTIQRQVAEVEAKVMNIDMSNFNVEMGKFNEETSKFNEVMGRRGAQMGRFSEEMGHMRTQIGAIINQSLKDGKARPVK